MTPSPVPVPVPTSAAAGKTEARPRPRDPYTGWRYAAELEVERAALLQQAVADRARIESLSAQGALFNAAMRACAQMQHPHISDDVHATLGCPPCEGHERLQSMLAEHRAAHPEDPAYAVPA